MAKTATKSKGKAANPKLAKDGKKRKKGKHAEADGGPVLSVAGHPVAKLHVRRAKAVGGLLGFALALFLSLQASVPLIDAGERALIAGFAGYLLGWACSVTIARQLMIAELKATAERLRKQHEEAQARAAD
jgi:hypothetical protein